MKADLAGVLAVWLLVVGVLACTHWAAFRLGRLRQARDAVERAVSRARDAEFGVRADADAVGSTTVDLSHWQREQDGQG